MHFKDDPISDMHAKHYLIILCLKHFPGPIKFGPVFWSRLFRRGPVEYNYPFTGLRIILLDDSYSDCFVSDPTNDRKGLTRVGIKCEKSRH